MKKNYVLDTNVLIYDPTAIFKFEENNVVLPITIIKEIDSFKGEMSERGKNAREIARLLDSLKQQGGSLIDGVELPSGGKLTVKISEGIERNLSFDDQILNTALAVRDESNLSTVLVSMDINLRLMAEVHGLPAEDYRSQSTNTNKIKNSYKTIEVDFDTNPLFRGGIYPEFEMTKNECFVLKLQDGRTILAREKKGLLKGISQHKDIMSISPRNMGQTFAMDFLLDDEINLLTIAGKAGSGKTLLALAAGLHKTVEQGTYSRMLVSRPVVPMGRDIGFLPGSINEKMMPWMKPIFDNLDLILMQRGKRRVESLDKLIQQGIVEIEPLTYIRGRSLPSQFIIIDECFPYDTLVTTEYGKRKIGSLFSQWIKGNELPLVKSFDENTKTFVWKKITNMFYQGIKPLVKVTAGNRQIKCTSNHPFLTYKGWVKAEDLTSNDLVVADHPNEIQINKVLSEDCEQVLLGSFLGDGSIEMIRNRVGRLSVSHGLDQSEYCKWKASLFQSKLKTVKNAGYNPDEDKVSFCSKAYGLPGYFPRPKTTCPQFVLDKLDARGLAIWFMDDGSVYPNYNGARIHTESFDDDSVNRMIAKLNDFGINSKKANYNGNVITIDKESYFTLCELIYPYIHDDLMYKIHEKYSGKNDHVWDSGNFEFGYVQVVSVEDIRKSDHVFDMEVEDTHNFIIPSSNRVCGQGGIVVHNCQNLTPHEIKTIITRCGENTKLILTGDLAQIDSPYLTESTNGLSYVMNKLQDEEIVANIRLEQGERSPLSNLAANKL